MNSPALVENCIGLARQPDNILVDDTGACWLGEASPAMAQVVHTVEIVFERHT